MRKCFPRSAGPDYAALPPAAAAAAAALPAELEETQLTLERTLDRWARLFARAVWRAVTVQRAVTAVRVITD